MNKKVALSLLSATVMASMAASAFAAPKSGLYIGGSVDKFYSMNTLFNLTDAADEQFSNEVIATGFQNLIYVDFDGKGASIKEIMDAADFDDAKKDLTEGDFEGVYTEVKADGTSDATYDPRKDATPDPTGELKVDSVSAITKTTVKVQFNKAVDSVAKENFSIAGGTVNAATLSEDKKSVTLTVSGLSYDTEYTVVASNILVDGKPVTLTGTKFETPAVTDVYNLELTTDAPGDQILANGADNMVITAQLKDKTTGKVDTNADNVVIAFSSTYGSLANTRVTVQDGVASVTLTSESSQKDLVSKIDAQIIEASGDYKDLINEVVGTKNVFFKVKLDDITPDQKPALVSAESNLADRVTLQFNQAVTPADFVQKGQDGKYLVDGSGNATLIASGAIGKDIVEVSQNNVKKAIRGFKPVEGNSKAIEVILQKTEFLSDNTPVKIEVNMPSNVGTQQTSANFILTDARKPEATSAVSQDLKTVVVKFSEPVNKSNEVQVDGGLLAINNKVFGEFNQVNLTDSRDTLTITTNDYMAAGTHSVQLSGIYDYAGLTDAKNISTNQTLDFSVAGDDSLPNATVSVESPEQIRVEFNKVVTGFGAATAKLQTLVKGTGGAADTWVEVTDASLNTRYAVDPAFDLDTVSSGSEYVLELKNDWTEIYNTSVTNKNYYNDQYRLVIPADAVTNPANGKKNAEIILPLNFSASKLNTADTISPVIAGFDDIAVDTFNVELSEPVKLPGQDNANTASEIQAAGSGVPTPIIEFLGKDKDGNAVTIKGQVVGYTDEDKADMNFSVKPAVGQPSLQALVDAGGNKNWTLVVRSISDDVGNTAASLTHNFVIEPGQQAAEVFKVKDATYNGVTGQLNGTAADTIVLDFTADVLFTGTVKNAVNPSNYLLDGEKLPAGTKITVSDSEVPAANGVDIVTITLPDGTLSATENNVITLSKSLESTKATKLTGEYEISFKPIADTTAPVAPVITTGPQTVNAASINIVGTAEANSTVTITGGAAAATGTADANGNFTISVNLTQDAVNNLSVTATDASGNVSAADTVAITEDSTSEVVQSSDTTSATTIDVAFNGSLAGTVADPAAFTVHIDAGTGTVTGVAVNGAIVTITLDASTPVANGNVVTVDYTASTTNDLQDAAGNKVANFAGQAVVNNQ